ncbi:MAG: biopolymer transporter ExbD, partial [Proteobacteria bacterium]|nr:biopolymer transporter ExbD [Pseudomonadota bacterium]
MRFKKIKDEEPRLGITPLIDIVFLLLIFFMVTSHFHMASGISIKLPKVTQRAFNKDSKKITLMIDREGRTYLKGDIIDLKKLATELKGLVVKEGLI